MSEVNHTHPHMPSHFIIHSPQTRSLMDFPRSAPFSSPHHSARQQTHGQVQARPATAPQGMALTPQVIHTSQHLDLTQNVALVRIVPNKE